LRLPHVIARRALGLVGIPALDGQHDAPMLGVGFGRPVGHPKGVAVQERQRVVHAVEGLDQVAIVRGFADGAVKAAVERDQQARIAAVLAEFIEQAMQDIDLGLVRVLGGEARL